MARPTLLFAFGTAKKQRQGGEDSGNNGSAAERDESTGVKRHHAACEEAGTEEEIKQCGEDDIAEDEATKDAGVRVRRAIGHGSAKR